MYLYLIDDDVLQHTLMKFYFQRNEVVEKHDFFFDATFALKQLSINADTFINLPDIILLDLNMPIMDGWQFLYQFKDIAPTLKKDIHIFIVSSSITESEMSKSRSFTFVKGFYSKPISPLDLKAILSTFSQHH
jgi:two-component system, chemotaxis family, chemotaxis protein CheY